MGVARPERRRERMAFAVLAILLLCTLILLLAACQAPLRTHPELTPKSVECCHGCCHGRSGQSESVVISNG